MGVWVRRATVATAAVLAFAISGDVPSVAHGSATPTHVLFAHLRNNTWDIAVADPTTSDVAHLTATRKSENDAVFSPDGSRIAFRAPGPEDFDLFVMKRDGNGRRRLTNGRTIDISPDWSPDGSQIAYSALRPGMSRLPGEGMWVVDVSTGNRRRMSFGAIDLDPQWSPDGSKILFYGFREGDYELMLVDASGGSVERLTDNRTNDRSPRWDADGNSIVYTRAVARHSPRSHLFRLHLSTGAVRRLTPDHTSDEAGIVSPDGTRIAFLRCPGTTCGLWVMRADGSGERELFDADVEGGPPVWSPDSTRLAFSHLNAGGRYDISVVDVSSREVSALTELRGDESVSDWG